MRPVVAFAKRLPTKCRKSDLITVTDSDDDVPLQRLGDNSNGGIHNIKKQKVVESTTPGRVTSANGMFHEFGNSASDIKSCDKKRVYQQIILKETQNAHVYSKPPVPSQPKLPYPACNAARYKKEDIAVEKVFFANTFYKGKSIMV